MLNLSVVLSLALSPHPHGSSLKFDKDPQVAIVPYQKAMDLPQATIEVWIKVEPSPYFYNYVLCRNYGDFGFGIAIHGRPDKVFSQAPGTKVPMGVWTHVAIVYSDKAQKTYINGELAAAGGRDTAHKAFAHDLMIGTSDMQGYPGNEPTPFRGQIDELRIWSKPHTQAEVRATMNRYLRGNEPHLLAYFPFDEGQGQFVHDYTGHLMSGSVGTSYQADDADPSWAEGVPLKGKTPRLREHR